MESSFSSLTFGRPVSPSSIGGLSDLRQIDLNLIYIIKEKMLPINGYVSSATETLSPSSQEVDPITGLTVTPYKAKYYDFVYFNPDASNPALTGLLTRPIVTPSGSLAYVDYPNGVIYFSGIQSSNIVTTYNYYSVAVQDGFPDWGEEIKDMSEVRIPLVSVDFSSRSNTPFALGGAYEENRNFMIDILANSDAQRDDLVDMIETALRYDYPYAQDFRLGFPILFNGDLNPLFDRGPASRWRHIRFKNVSSRVVRNPLAHDKMRHRALVNLSIETT